MFKKKNQKQTETRTTMESNKLNMEKALLTGPELFFPAGKKRIVGNPSACKNKTKGGFS